MRRGSRPLSLPGRAHSSSSASAAYTPRVSNDVSDVQERAGRNESRYRNLNERMEPSNAVHVWVDPPMPDWICECASTECMQPFV